MRNSLFFLSLITLFFQSPLHGSNDVTELVEDTAPAVVNITSKREVSLGANNYFRGIPEEFERFFGIPRDFNPEPRTRGIIACGWVFYKDNFL